MRELEFKPSLKTMLREGDNRPRPPQDHRLPKGVRRIWLPAGVDVPGVGLIGGNLLRLPETDVDDRTISIVRSFPETDRLILRWCRVSDRGVSHMTSLKELKALELDGTSITDRGIRELSKAARLEELSLSLTRMTNEGVKSIAKLKQLRALDLSDTAIDDDALDSLAGLKRLEILGLRGTRISDAGLVRIAEMKNLKIVSVDFTRVTNGGFQLLKLARPDLQFEETTWSYEDDKDWLKNSNRYLGVPQKSPRRKRDDAGRP